MKKYTADFSVHGRITVTFEVDDGDTVEEAAERAFEEANIGDINDVAESYMLCVEEVD